MRARGACLAAGMALCAGLACKTEVTISLLKDLAGDASLDAADAGDDMGTVTPPPCQKLGPEVCNGGDDDCNGIVDDGCSYTVAWTPEPDGVALGHDVGGVTFLAPCHDGSVLTGLLVGMGKWLNQVVAVCRQIELHVDSTQSPAQFSATLGPRLDSSFAPATTPDTTNQVQDLLCPTGMVLSAVDGTTSMDARRYILGIRITCAPAVVTTGASGPAFDSDRTRPQTVGPVICGTCAATQVFDFTTTIDPGHVATRLFGGDGLWIDRVGFGASLATIKAR